METTSKLQNLISQRWGISEHSCNCNKSKTGLVFYVSKETKFKNVVLFICEKCYGYDGNIESSHHQQLLKYYQIMYPYKTHLSVAGFSIKQSGELDVNSTTFNSNRDEFHSDYSLAVWEVQSIKDCLAQVD